MQQVLSSQTFNTIHQDACETIAIAEKNLLERFISWCDAQEEKRFLWLAVGFIVNIGAVLPFTLLALILIGINNHFALLMIVCCVNVPVLALNLAAQPTKVTLPSLFLAWVINAAVIAYCISSFLYNC